MIALDGPWDLAMLYSMQTAMTILAKSNEDTTPAMADPSIPVQFTSIKAPKFPSEFNSYVK